MWFFDGNAWPGWHDYLGIALAVAGFWVTISQIVKTRTETAKATAALAHAQKQLSARALLVLVTHFQTVSEDLAYALPHNDVQVARRALVRFSHLAMETVGVLGSLDGNHSEVSDRMSKASDKATKVKGTLMSTASPDVTAIVKSITSEIDKLGQDMTGLSSSLRNTIDGGTSVQR
ncbi:hypothetical protein [Plantibacter sp. ME-Dv--P-095]|uniref:hypothetical protein n=1 Tax=Plantibacter sp. ME-Dv--P-095 TaxID=3040299 RepID=UPI00254E05F1|nr:hypothetical protein [Plantibacter sp. ME-Dv--P-095]